MQHGCIFLPGNVLGNLTSFQKYNCRRVKGILLKPILIFQKMKKTFVSMAEEFPIVLLYIFVREIVSDQYDKP